MQSAAISPVRISRTRAIVLRGMPDEVFPLFGPIREQEWAPGWAPTIIHPSGVLAEAHMVFTARSHDADEAECTWTISTYDPEHGSIEYTVFAPGRLWTIAIRCHPGQADRTARAEVTYTYTGVTDRGRRLNEAALERMFHRDLKDWEEQINRTLDGRAGRSDPLDQHRRDGRACRCEA
ncbi:MAG: hypothetical protein NTU91_11225 [Chloroflexi bacterium]|nr:hypothetical protein [Chloroflexota bacterium]